VHTWREESAVAREKAEKERARWEKIREAQKAQHHADGTEEAQVSSATGLPHRSVGLGDARELVTVEISQASKKVCNNF
jgi:hypothetical protein